MDEDRLYRAASAYIERGWWVFTVSQDKVPFKNCGNCPPGAHAGGACSCLRCHGHLAATRDKSRVAAMIALARGNCCLAVATGPSGLVVVDAEGDDRTGYGQTGLDTLDEWETWTAGKSLPGRPGTRLAARTGSGGLHLFFRGSVTGMNRLLPGVDVKSRGGYVVVPPAEGRRWRNYHTGVLWDWDAGVLAGRKPVSYTGRGGGAGVGALAVVDAEGTIPDGLRYEYTRDLVYKLRKQGVSWEEMREIMLREWSRFAQPPAARYEMPWSRVEYEMTRVWARVEPDAPAPAEFVRWVEGVR